MTSENRELAAIGALRSALVRMFYGLGLERRLYQVRALLRGAEAQQRDAHGVPIPPVSLVNMVVGDISTEQFLTSGETALRHFAAAVDRNGGDFRGARRILDFGCGCGRLARHAGRLSDAKVFGVDYNRDLVAWCGCNLPGEFRANGLNPPLEFPDNYFDVVWLLSVFTHLRTATQNAWLAELRRVVRPGGFVLITFHDENCPKLGAAGLTPDDLIEKGTVVYQDSVEGSNYLAAFHSRAAARRQFGKYFDVAEIAPGGEAGTGQALAVLRRPE